MNDTIYADVPKDLSKIKTKLFFHLTKRQLICFGGGALAGVPLYFLTRGVMSSTLAMVVMIAVMMPFFLLALYEKNGEPLEKIARHIIQSRFKRPRKRPYQTNNLYAAIVRQTEINKEVKAIVRESVQKKKSKRGKKAAQGQVDAG